MELLDKFLGSDRNLKGPDFNQASRRTISLSDIRISFLDPKHSAMFPQDVFSDSVDIFDTENFEHVVQGVWSRTLYVKGWSLKGRGGKVQGGITLDIYLGFYNGLSRGDGLEDPDIMASTILDYCNGLWGGQKDESVHGSQHEKTYTYPVEKSDLDVELINGKKWFAFKALKKGLPPQLGFATAISPKHMIYLDFEFFAYNGHDYFSPDTNMEEVCQAAVDRFTNSFEITDT